MVRVSEETCKKCIWGGEYSEGCSYMVLNRKSRLIENGEKYNPKYCTKFKEGVKGLGETWKKERSKHWVNGKYI